MSTTSTLRARWIALFLVTAAGCAGVEAERPRCGSCRGDASLDATLDGGAPGGASTDAGPRGPSDAAPPDAACAAVESAAQERRRPVDVIVLPDDSSSMGDARDAVVASMESVFRAAMEAEGIDYRVIWHGRSPLPGIEAAGRLVRNPVRLGSDDDAMFAPVLDTYDEWRPALRDDALRVIVHFTDARGGDGAEIEGYGGTLDAALATREPALWGSPGAPRFVYHGFVGIAADATPARPYEPTEPLVVGECSDAVRNPVPLQTLAQRTGGLRFPLCAPESFEAVFVRIAASAIERAALPCQLALPTPPEGRELDLGTVAVRHVSTEGVARVLQRAADETACDAEHFLLRDDARIELCPAACERVEADRRGVLTVLTGCAPELY